MLRVAVDVPRVLVLADETKEKGRLFEEFVGLLLGRLGYEQPTDSNFNVTANGIELDVVLDRRLEGGRAIVECKAYSAPVPASSLDAFYGKLAVERFNDAGSAGFFLALPSLSSPGEEQARTIEMRDPAFRYLNATNISQILREEKLVVDPPAGAGILSDPLVLITREGIHQAAYRLDTETRVANALVVWSAKSVPEVILTSLRSHEVSGGLPVVREGEPAPRYESEEPVIAPVAQSADDFEYHLPAAPKFFIGRRAELVSLGDRLIDGDPMVLVLNAQSGWGKSSLALKLSDVAVRKGGRALVLDARTASSTAYVPAAMQALAAQAESAGILRLPGDAAFGSVASSLRTFDRAEWLSPQRPLLVFFDQFENVFRDSDLTRTFRDLALGVHDLLVPLKVGFAWKTDLVGWTEGHPYQLRDEIRSNARVAVLHPFGPREVSTLLTRLQNVTGQKLGKDIRDRLREYSGGLPWLFKKLAGHILAELRQGRSQESLLAEALNVQGLFDADLAELSPPERETLVAIARTAPVAVSELLESIDLQVVQSLLDRRLVVQVGEKLDTYWDIFRDYLNTGTVPIKDGYIIRLNPTSTMGKLLQAALDAGGSISILEGSSLLRTSDTVVFNMVRDLRLLGLVSYEPGTIHVASEVSNASDPDRALRLRAAAALRRHRAFAVLEALLEAHGGAVEYPEFATHLALAFPSVEAKPATWDTYARAFSYWFAYAELAGVTSAGITNRPNDTQADLSLIGRVGRVSSRGAFPQSPAGPAISVGSKIARGEPIDLQRGRVKKALTALDSLGILLERGSKFSVDAEVFDSAGTVSRRALRSRLEARIPGAAEAIRQLEEYPATSAMEIGSLLKSAQGTALAGDDHIDCREVFPFLGWGGGDPNHPAAKEPANSSGHDAFFGTASDYAA